MNRHGMVAVLALLRAQVRTSHATAEGAASGEAT